MRTTRLHINAITAILLLACVAGGSMVTMTIMFQDLVDTGIIDGAVEFAVAFLAIPLGCVKVIGTVANTFAENPGTNGNNNGIKESGI